MDRKQFRGFVQGLEGVVLGDTLDRTIRKQQEWGLMPSFGFMTCVYSTKKISDSIGFPQFPSRLGKNSSERKNRRLTRELKNSIFPLTLCSSHWAVKNYSSTILLQELVSHLKSEHYEKAVELMESYRLTPASLNENLASLSLAEDKSSPLNAVPSQAKAKLTRLFNKRH